MAIGDFVVPRVVDFDADTGWILIRPCLPEDEAPVEEPDEEPVEEPDEEPDEQPESTWATGAETTLLPLVPQPRHSVTAGRHSLRRRGGGRSLVLLAAAGAAVLIAITGGVLLAGTGDRSGGPAAAAVDAPRASGGSRPSDPSGTASPADPATLAALPRATQSRTDPGAGRPSGAALPPTWAPPPAADRTGPITNRAGLCLASSDDRARLWSCDGTSSQTWTLATDGTLRLGAQCLQPGTGLARLRNCDGSAAQQWRVGPAGSLVDPAAVACLGDPESGANKGTPQRTAPCDQSDAQRWTLPGAGG